MPQAIHSRKETSGLQELHRSWKTLTAVGLAHLSDLIVQLVPSLHNSWSARPTSRLAARSLALVRRRSLSTFVRILNLNLTLGISSRPTLRISATLSFGYPTLFYSLHFTYYILTRRRPQYTTTLIRRAKSSGSLLRHSQTLFVSRPSHSCQGQLGQPGSRRQVCPLLQTRNSQAKHRG